MKPVGHARVLVTGGAGFIGSHLAEALIARGAKVVALDDMSTGSYRNVPRSPGSRRFCSLRRRFCSLRTRERAAVRRAIRELQCAYAIVQDADLEVGRAEYAATSRARVRGPCRCRIRLTDLPSDQLPEPGLFPKSSA